MAGDPAWLGGQWTRLHPDWDPVGILRFRSSPEMGDNIVYELNFQEQLDARSLQPLRAFCREFGFCFGLKKLSEITEQDFGVPRDDLRFRVCGAVYGKDAGDEAFWRLAPGEGKRFGGPDMEIFIASWLKEGD